MSSVWLSLRQERRVDNTFSGSNNMLRIFLSDGIAMQVAKQVNLDPYLRIHAEKGRIPKSAQRTPRIPHLKAALFEVSKVQFRARMCSYIETVGPYSRPVSFRIGVLMGYLGISYMYIYMYSVCAELNITQCTVHKNS